MDFFFLLPSTDNEEKMNYVNTLVAPQGDSPQIKVHFMVQIQCRT